MQNNINDNVTIPPNTNNENQNSTNTEITQDQNELDSLKEPNAPSLSSSSPLNPPSRFQSPKKVKPNKPKAKKKVVTGTDGIDIIGNSPLRQKGGGKLDEIADRFLKAKVVSPSSKNNNNSDDVSGTANVSLTPTHHKVEMTNLIYQYDINDDEPSPVANFSALAQMSHMNRFLREATPKRIRNSNHPSKSPLESPKNVRSSPTPKRGNENKSPARNTTVRWIH